MDKKTIFIVLLLQIIFFSVNGQIIQSVSGNVTDSSGTALSNISIRILGKNTGVVSDKNGNYIIRAKEGDILSFSSIGYTTIEKRVESNTLDVVMHQAENLAGDEIVVVGYGTQKKENLTGAVSQIKMEEVLGDRPVINTTSALQGAVPGLQITRSSTPGQNSNSINLRGDLSINGGAPLVLIDNVPGEIGMLNPEDIETVTVLKDAASSAIYGARAAGGVILITTKRPKNGTRFSINYNNNFGLEKVINTPQQAPLNEYFRAYEEAGFPNIYWATSQDVKKWINYLGEYEKNPSNFDIIGDGIYVDDSGIPYFLHEQDLYKNFLQQGKLQTHNVSVQGASSNVRYRMSGGYNSEDGPFITKKDFYKRLNIGSFVSADITSWFTQEVDFRFAKAKKNLPGDETGALYSLRLVSYYPEGDLPASLSMNNANTPLFTPKNILLNSQISQLITNNTRLYAKSIIKPFAGLEGVFEYTYNKDDNNYSYYSNQWTYTTVQLAATTVPQKDYYIKRRYFTDYNAFNIYATYTKSFLNHNFKLMAGWSQEESYYEYINNRAEEQAVHSVPSFNGALGLVANNDDYSEYAIRGKFFRFNYNYKSKYLLEVNGRYDGSSKFPQNSRFGFFPSVSVGWQLAKENFMAFTQNWLDELKLRGSYGSIGNQNINPYQYTPFMEISKSNVWANNMDRVTVIGVPDLVSDNFTWETVTSLDFGMDLTALRRRLSATLDWYQRDTKDMLTQGVIQLPAVVGATAPTQNSANMRTRGYEISIAWNDRIGKVGYRISANLYDRKSWITKFENNASGLLNNWYVGRYFGEIWGYKTDGYYSINDFENTSSWKLKEDVTSIRGVNVKPGDVKFVNLKDDQNSKNQIDFGENTLSNPGDLSIIGNNTPRYLFGSNLGINYEGFDINILLQGVGKRDYWIGGQALFPFAGSGASDAVFQPIYYNQTDYWTAKSYDPNSPDYMVAVNPDATYFRVYNQMENSGSNTRTSDKFLQSGAYLRVKNITLSYIFPQNIVRKTSLRQIKVFASVENVATFTSLPKGFDPEIISWSYPFYRTSSIGINITL